MKLKVYKGRLVIMVIALILVLALMWLLGRCSHKETATFVRNYSKPGGDTIAVAIEISPTSYYFNGDTISGFDYEMLNEIAKQNDRVVKFFPFVAVDEGLKGLKKGDYDIVIATLPASTALKDEFLLTEHVFVDRQVLIRRIQEVDSTDNRPPQLKLLGDTVWIVDSTPYRERMSNLSHELGDTIYVMSDKQYGSEHLVLLTATGDIKQAVVNESVVRRLASELPELDIPIPISMSQFQPWLLKSDKGELKDSLDVWISDFKNTERYNELINKYF